MAEGWLRALGGEAYTALSAGIEAHGQNPRAIAVMAEAGVDISGQHSKILDPAWLEDLDLLVTVCGHADANCPLVPTNCRKEHWPFEDPAQATGNEEEIMDEFRRIRDQIKAKIEQYIRNN